MNVSSQLIELVEGIESKKLTAAISIRKNMVKQIEKEISKSKRMMDPDLRFLANLIPALKKIKDLNFFTNNRNATPKELIKILKVKAGATSPKIAKATIDFAGF